MSARAAAPLTSFAQNPKGLRQSLTGQQLSEEAEMGIDLPSLELIYLKIN
jgi:hypothetical protein